MSLSDVRRRNSGLIWEKTLIFSSFVTSHPLEISQEMPLMPAFTAGFTVFALLTMFHYVTVAHISPTVTFGFALRNDFQIDINRSIKQLGVGLL